MSNTIFYIFINMEVRFKRLGGNKWHVNTENNRNEILWKDDRIYSIPEEKWRKGIGAMSTINWKQNSNIQIQLAQSLSRMENIRIPKIMMAYKPRGHRRPMPRLLDGAETGLNTGVIRGRWLLMIYHLNLPIRPRGINNLSKIFNVYTSTGLNKMFNSYW